MKYDRNFFIALVLSFVCVWVWQFYYYTHHKPKAAQLQTTNLAPAAVPVLPQHSKPQRLSSKAEQLSSAAGSVKIETPSLAGSINLQGCRFDNLSLKNYSAEATAHSQPVQLLAPAGSPKSYYAGFYYKDERIEKSDLPNASTLWHIEGAPHALTIDHPLQLSFTNNQGIKFLRLICVDKNYMFSVRDTITNRGNHSIALTPLAQIKRAAPPEAANKTYLLHEGFIAFLGEQGLKTVKYKSITKPHTDPDSAESFQKATGGWVGITDKYWAVATIPTQNQEYEAQFRYTDNSPEPYSTNMVFNSQNLSPAQTLNFTHYLFAGAKQAQILDAYQEKLHIQKLNLLVDWGWFSFITKPMYSLIHWIYSLSGNFGLTILIITILLKVLLFPLAYKSYKSLLRMKVLQPKIAEIKKLYDNDNAKIQKATLELYQKEKINPLAGCLPMLVQMVLFFALYKVLNITIEMRHAPFFGWIHDLSAPDPTSFLNLFGLLPFAAPHFLHLGAWPLVMGLTMFLQMRMNPAPSDPIQGKILAWMPLIFTFTLASFPAGLVIYWTWNNLLTILQQLVMAKREGVKIDLWNNVLPSFGKDKGGK